MKQSQVLITRDSRRVFRDSGEGFEEACESESVEEPVTLRRWSLILAPAVRVAVDVDVEPAVDAFDFAGVRSETDDCGVPFLWRAIVRRDVRHLESSFFSVINTFNQCSGFISVIA